MGYHCVECAWNCCLPDTLMYHYAEVHMRNGEIAVFQGGNACVMCPWCNDLVFRKSEVEVSRHLESCTCYLGWLLSGGADWRSRSRE